MCRKMNTIRAFISKTRTLFSISKRVGEASPVPPSCASVGVTEYASIFKNISHILENI